MIKLNKEIFKNKLNINPIDDYQFKILINENSYFLIKSDENSKSTFLILNKEKKELKLNFFIPTFRFYCSLIYHIPEFGDCLVIESFSEFGGKLNRNVIDVSIITFKNKILEAVYSFNTNSIGIEAFEIKNNKLEIMVSQWVAIDEDDKGPIVCINKFFLDKKGFIRNNEKPKCYLHDLEEDILLEITGYNCIELKDCIPFKEYLDTN